MKELPIIIKADVQGSAEVLADTLTKLSDERVKIRIIHSGVGAINESDVLLGAASNAIVIGFNVRPDRNAADVAEREKVDIRLHSVIYNVTDEMKKAMAGPARPDAQGSAASARPRCARCSRCRSSAPSPAAWSPKGASRARATRRRACCATTWSSTRARSARCAASRTTCREVKAGFECGIGFEKLQRHQGRRRHRGVRRRARRHDGLGEDAATHGRHGSAIRSGGDHRGCWPGRCTIRGSAF